MRAVQYCGLLFIGLAACGNEGKPSRVDGPALLLLQERHVSCTAADGTVSLDKTLPDREAQIDVIEREDDRWDIAHGDSFLPNYSAVYEEGYIEGLRRNAKGSVKFHENSLPSDTASGAGVSITGMINRNDVNVRFREQYPTSEYGECVVSSHGTGKLRGIADPLDVDGVYDATIVAGKYECPDQGAVYKTADRPMNVLVHADGRVSVAADQFVFTVPSIGENGSVSFEGDLNPGYDVHTSSPIYGTVTGTVTATGTELTLTYHTVGGKEGCGATTHLTATKHLPDTAVIPNSYSILKRVTASETCTVESETFNQVTSIAASNVEGEFLMKGVDGARLAFTPDADGNADVAVATVEADGYELNYHIEATPPFISYTANLVEPNEDAEDGTKVEPCAITVNANGRVRYAD